jgi:hypothetical protein
MTRVSKVVGGGVLEEVMVEVVETDGRLRCDAWEKWLCVCQTGAKLSKAVR